MTLGIPCRAAITAFFCLFVLFLYGPTLTIVVLSFQGPDGGLTFPMNGASLHWFARLFVPQAVGDFGGALKRSLLLALIVMAATVVISLAAGLAFRRRFIGANALFTLTIASLIIPSILVSLGIGLLFRTVTTALSFLAIGVSLLMMAVLRRAATARRSGSVPLADQTDIPAQIPPVPQ